MYFGYSCVGGEWVGGLVLSLVTEKSGNLKVDLLFEPKYILF